MSEVQALPVLNGFDPASQRGAGALLRQAREASGLHIAALAVLLKVPVKKLEALESDRLDLLPDVVFVRALASSVCRTLKIDSSAILARLPQTEAPKLIYQGTSINEPFRAPGDGPRPMPWAQVSRTATLAGTLLLLGTLVLIFLPFIKAGIEDITAVVALPNTQTANGEKAAPATSTSTPTTAADAPLVGLEPTARSGPASGLASDTSTTPTAAQTAVQPALPTQPQLAQQPALAANAGVDPDPVVFTAKTESWIQATDANGKIVLRRTLAAGEVVGASGALPLKVIVGRADAIQVEIRGKVFDANAVAKDNVARFEVK